MNRIKARNDAWFPGFIPAHELYADAAIEISRPGDRVLHLGAGRDALGIAARLAGREVTAADTDPQGLALNPNPRRVLADGASLPFPGDYFDLIMCEHVFEHLQRPSAVLKECSRVLRSGGRLLFLTPNRWSYIAIIAALTPYRFHVWYKSKMIGTAAVDTFPTCYLLNTRNDIERLANEAGMRLETFESLVGWPTYLERGEWMHRFGVLLHRLLESLPERFHISFIGALRKCS